MQLMLAVADAKTCSYKRIGCSCINKSHKSQKMQNAISGYFRKHRDLSHSGSMMRC